MIPLQITSLQDDSEKAIVFYFIYDGKTRNIGFPQDMFDSVEKVKTNLPIAINSLVKSLGE